PPMARSVPRSERLESPRQIKAPPAKLEIKRSGKPTLASLETGTICSRARQFCLLVIGRVSIIALSPFRWVGLGRVLRVFGSIASEPRRGKDAKNRQRFLSVGGLMFKQIHNILLRLGPAPLSVNFLQSVKLLVESLKSFLHFADFRRETSNPLLLFLGFGFHPSHLFLFFGVLCSANFLTEFLRGFYFGPEAPDVVVLFCHLGLQLF